MPPRALRLGVVALLERGEFVNAEDERHQTPLHVSAQGGRAGMTRLLLQKGADADKRDAAGRTPLFLAAGSGFPEAVRVLLASGGADYTLRSYDHVALWRKPLKWGTLRLCGL